MRGQKEVPLKSSLFAALALALTTAVTIPAMARENANDFPMPAAAFQRHVDARLKRAEMRLEAYISENKLSDAQASELHQHFDAVAQDVEAEAQKACADGKVTLEEARAVRAVARQLRMQRRHGDV
jgi:FKBP-type peptidyl-prolyl cis-trans isomerase (trigger factor)